VLDSTSKMGLGSLYHFNTSFGLQPNREINYLKERKMGFTINSVWWAGDRETMLQSSATPGTTPNKMSSQGESVTNVKAIERTVKATTKKDFLISAFEWENR